MVTDGLHGNGEQCPSCSLRREEADRRIGGKVDIPCNQCGGTGWLRYTTRRIVAETVTTARATYWPARERAFAKHNRRMKCRSTA
jgi:hypothetical protein